MSSRMMDITILVILPGSQWQRTRKVAVTTDRGMSRANVTPRFHYPNYGGTR